MSLYDGLFGAKKMFGLRKDCPEHFQVRPFAQHVLDECAEPPLPSPIIPASQNSAAGRAGYDCDHATDGQHANGLAPTPQPAPRQSRELQRAGTASVPQQEMPSSNVAVDAWHDRYDRSLGNIQDHIHAVAGAVAMLDAVEHKMIAIKCELQRIRDTGLMIDGEKVLIALQALSDYVNHAITSVDDQCVNMLRDAKLEIRFAELDSRHEQAEGVALTMISVERLLDFKIKSAFAEGLVAEETPEFVDDICAVVSSNIQILTSVMLALFASRDYTQAVTKLAARESIIPSIGDSAKEQIAAATIDRLQFENIDQQNGAGNDYLKEGRASLTELLENVRQNRGGLNAPYN